MNINAVGSAQTELSPFTSGTRQQPGQQEFLQLLVAQLRYQDPLNPQQGQEFVAQLAQFSTVEQLISINSGVTQQGGTLGELVSQVRGLREQQTSPNGMALLEAASLVGRTAEANGGYVGLGQDGEAKLNFRLGSDAANGTVTIRNADGQTVRVLSFGEMNAGSNVLSWDGISATGERLPEGTYTFQISASSPSGGNAPAQGYLQGAIERVQQTPRGLMALIGGALVPLSALTSIGTT